MTLNAIENVLSQPAAQATAWALLQFVWQGAAVGALAAIALAAMRRSASDVRYVVASVGLALMLTLPIVSGVQRFQALRADQSSSRRPRRRRPGRHRRPRRSDVSLNAASTRQAANRRPSRPARCLSRGSTP
jgi:hypothetical protein